MQTDHAKAGLEYFSMGTVAEHLKSNETKIEVIPIDKQPFNSGKVVADAVEVKSSVANSQGEQVNTSTLASKAITADWIGDSGNRVTPPNVRRGDEVRIYRNADSDQYFWEAVNRDDSRRRLEKAKWRFSATKDESVKKLDDTNSYTIDVDGETGAITVRTSTANGEAAPIAVRLDGKKGFVAIEVGEGNFLEIFHGKDGKVSLYNNRGTCVELDGAQALVKSDQRQLYKTKAHDTEAKTITRKADTETVTLNNGTVDANSYTVNSRNISLNAPNMSVGTGMSVSGDSWTQSSGSMTFNSTVNLTQNVNLSDSVAQQIANRIRPYL